MKSGIVSFIEDDIYEIWDEEETVRTFQRGKDVQFNPNHRNRHVFTRKTIPDRKLIRMKFLERGDVIRKCGSVYIVMYRADSTIYYSNFDIEKKQSGGGGKHNTGQSGTKNNEIVEYEGFYNYLHSSTRVYAFMAE
jgi:hypothetical protein